jgi:hypothetical protein
MGKTTKPEAFRPGHRDGSCPCTIGAGTPEGSPGQPAVPFLVPVQ